MQNILSHKHQLVTFFVSVILSVFLVALYVSGASLVDTDSVGVGTTTVGAGLYVADYANIGGELQVEDSIQTSFLSATSTTASSFAGSVGVGTTTPGSGIGLYVSEFADIGGVLEVEDSIQTSFLSATSTTASSFAGSVGAGTTTPGTTPIGLYVSEYANIGGVLELEDHLETSFVRSTSTTASYFGTSTTPGASDTSDTFPTWSTAPNFTISNSASTTLFITNTASSANVGSAIILKDMDGEGCSVIGVNNGIIQVSDVKCPN